MEIEQQRPVIRLLMERWADMIATDVEQEGLWQTVQGYLNRPITKEDRVFIHEITEAVSEELHSQTKQIL